MNRYDKESTKQIKDTRGSLSTGYDQRTTTPVRKVYSSTVYPKIERNSDDVFIETRIGDRFDMLAHEFYGDVTLWWIIAKANNLINGSLAVTPGTRLRVPVNQEDILNTFYEINQERK